MNNEAYPIYTTPDGKRYQFFPTLVWFDKKTQSFVGEEAIHSIRYVDLTGYLSGVVGMDIKEKIFGQTYLDKDEDITFLQPYCIHEINFNKYDYALSFDNVVWINK